MIQNVKQMVLHRRLADAQQNADKCYICVKIALSSTFEQISNSWSHIG